MDPFVIKLFWSFIIGSIWITLSTILAEKFGSKVGGWIGGLPTTTLFALLFIGITQSIPAVVKATEVMPATISFAAILMVVFSFFINQGFLKAFSLGLLSWFILATLTFYIKPSFPVSLLISLLIIIFSYYMLEKRQKVLSAPKQKVIYTLPQILARASFAGLVISLAVLIARIGGPILGGIFSSFPSFFISTLFILYFTHGMEFTKAVVKSLTLSGVINVIIYAVAVRFLYPTQGLFLGTILAYLITILSVILTYKWFGKKIN